LRTTLAKKFCARDPVAESSPQICNKDSDCGENGPCVKRQVFARGRAISVSAAHDSEAILATKLSRVCVATSVAGGSVIDDRLDLACYKVDPAKDLCKVDPTLSCADPVPQSISTANDLSSDLLATKKRGDFCVPARVDLY